MSFKPGEMRPICPRCGNYIGYNEDTGRFKPDGPLFHAGCLEDLIRSDTEVAEVRDATT